MKSIDCITSQWPQVLQYQSLTKYMSVLSQPQDNAQLLVGFKVFTGAVIFYTYFSGDFMTLKLSIFSLFINKPFAEL